MKLSEEEIKDAVTDGAMLHNSLYNSQIQDAIADGAKLDNSLSAIQIQEAIAQGVKMAIMEIERIKGLNFK